MEKIMGAKKIFTRSRILITAVVLAVLVAISAVVLIFATEKATFKGVQVAADGYVNLRFHYTINDESVTSANVYIWDGDNGYLNGGEPIVVELKTEVVGDETQTYFEVPLAAAQMGCDVTVVPLDEYGYELVDRGSKNAPTWSVKDYADKVFADSSYSSEYYAGLKAIMNYGHFASEFFSVGNTVVENEGIYGRGTNPIVAMTKLLRAGEGPKVTVLNDEVTDVEVKIALEDSVSIRLYYTYTGSRSHTGQDNPAGEPNRYYVSVDNIGANQYTNPYGAYLDVSVGSETAVTVENATVISCLEKLMGSDDEKLQNLALALYNFYHWTNSSIEKNEATCSHFMHYEYVEQGITQPVCTLCGKTLNYLVSDEINYFSAPGQVINNYASVQSAGAAHMDARKEVMTNLLYENGVDYTRVYLGPSYGCVIFGNGTVGYGYNPNVWQGSTFMNMNAEGIALNELMEGQSVGRYAVLKVRTPGANQLDIGFLNGFKNHNFAGNLRKLSEGASEIGTGDWTVYVIDFGGDAIVNPAASVFNSVLRAWRDGDEDPYVDIAYLANCDTIREVKMLVAGEEHVVSNDISWSDTENDKIYDIAGHRDHSAMLLADVTSDEAGNKTYTYTCANLCCAEQHVKTVSANTNYYSAPGQFVNFHFGSSDPNAAPPSVSPEANTTMEQVSVDGDGTIFTRVYASTWTRVTLANGTATKAHGGGNMTPNLVDHINTNSMGVTQGVGKYAVLKFRASATFKNIGIEIATDVSGDVTNGFNPGNRWIGNGMKEFPSGYNFETFAIYVIDISKIADPTATRINVNIVNRYAPAAGASAVGGYFDIAYFAICDSWSEVASVVGEGEVVHHLTDWTQNTGVNKSFDGTCLAGCTERHVVTNDTPTAGGEVCYNTVDTTYKCSVETCPNYNEIKSVTTTKVAHKLGLPTVENKTYTYKCSECDSVVARLSVPMDISYYSAPGYASNIWGATNKPTTAGGLGSGANQDGNSVTGLLSTVGYDNGVVYTRINAHNSTTVALVDEHYSASNKDKYKQTATAFDPLGDRGLGKYVVLKIRTNNFKGDAVRLNIEWKAEGATSTTRPVGDNYKYGLTTTNGEFVTYVFHLTPQPTADYIGVSIGSVFGAGFEAGMSLDVAYFAICYDEAQLLKVIENETEVRYTPSWNSSASNDVVHSKDHTCTTAIKLKGTLKSDNGSVEHVYGCDNYMCRTSIIVPTGISFYSAPGQVVNNWATSNTPVTSGSGLEANKVVITNLISDENGVYTRVHLANNGTTMLTNQTSTVTYAERTPTDTLTANAGGMGRYYVLKVRTHGITGLRMGVYSQTASESAMIGPNFNGPFRNNAAEYNDDEFTIYVIDRGAAVNPDATKINVVFGAWTQAATGGYLDIAYFAVCDDWTEIRSVVGDDNEKVVLTTWAKDGTAPNGQYGTTPTTDKIMYANGTCLDCSCGAPTVSGSVYTYTCTACGKKSEVVKPNGMNYFSAPGQLVNNWACANVPNATNNGLSSGKVLLTDVRSDADGVYTRVHMAGGGSFILANGTVAAGSQEENKAKDVLSGGLGRYIVMKLRNNGCNAIRWGFRTDMVDNGVTGMHVGWTGTWRTKDHPDMTDGEFHVYVIDLGTWRGLDDSTKIQMIMGGGDNDKGVVAGSSIDVAYVANCDTIAEVYNVIGNDENIIFDVRWNTSEYGSGYGEYTNEQFRKHFYDDIFVLYEDGAEIQYAGIDWSVGAFADTVHSVDESKAQSITADQLIVKLSNGTLRAGEVYRVSEIISLPSGTYNGNGAAVIAENGIFVSGVDSVLVENLLIEGGITVKDSESVTFNMVDVKNSDTAAFVDKDSSNILFENCRLYSDSMAVYSEADDLTVYSCYLRGLEGAWLSGDGIMLQNCKIYGSDRAVYVEGNDVIVRENTVTALDSGYGIAVAEGSSNVLVALNDITGVQASVVINGSFNTSVVLNRAVVLYAKGNKNLYVVDNSLGGYMDLQNNNYLIVDGNKHPTDSNSHDMVDVNNKNVNGDNITNVSARVEVGANVDLLPHTNKDQFVGMERKDTVPDASFKTAKSVNAYLNECARNSDVVVVAPGAYSVPFMTNSRAIYLDSKTNGTTIYAYGVYFEISETNVKNYSGRFLMEMYNTNNLSIYGLSVGVAIPSSGQVRVVDKYVEDGQYKLTVVTDAGFLQGFTKADTSENNIFHTYWPETFIYDEKTGEYRMYPEENPDNYHECVMNADGTMTITIKNKGNGSGEKDWYAKDIWERITKGTVMTCRYAYGAHSIYANHSTNLTMRDFTFYGYSSSMANVALGTDKVTYDRFHNATHSESLIDEETYNKYLALEVRWGVDMEIRREVLEDGTVRYRGPASRSGSVDAFHVTSTKTGYNVVSSLLEGMVDDGANMKANSSRLNAIRDNGDGTVTIEFKDTMYSTKWSQLYTASAANRKLSVIYCHQFKAGDTVFVYAPSGKVLCETPALTNSVNISTDTYTFAGGPAAGPREYSVVAQVYSVTVSADAINWDALRVPAAIDQGSNEYKYSKKAGDAGYEVGSKLYNHIVIKSGDRFYDLENDGNIVNLMPSDNVGTLGGDYIDSQRMTVDNLSWNACDYTMDNVMVFNGHSRGFLIKSTDVTIKHCTFKNVSYAALLIKPEAGWAESTIARRILIQQCLFDNNGYMSNHLTYKEYACITICSTSTIADEDTLPIDDITITGCKFTNNKQQNAIYVNSAKNIKITNNVFDDTVASYGTKLNGCAVLLETCMNVEISDNTYNYSNYNGNASSVIWGTNYKNIFYKDANGVERQLIADKLN